MRNDPTRTPPGRELHPGGAGGMVELNVQRGFRLCSVEQLGSGDAVEIAAELLQEADNDVAAGDPSVATEADE